MKIIQLLVVLAIGQMVVGKFQTTTHLQKSKLRAHTKHHSKVRSKKSKQDSSPVQLEHLKAKYIFNVTDNESIDDQEVKLVEAFPAGVETELQFRVGLKEGQYDSKYDKRQSNFSCSEDHMGGQLFMIERAMLVDKKGDLEKQLQAAFFQAVTGSLSFSKVNINMNAQKLSISDTNKELKEMIRMDTVYPRLDMMKSIIDDKDDVEKRNKLDALKVRMFNASSIFQTLDDKYPAFFCFSLINEKQAMQERLGLFKQQLDDNLDDSQELDILYNFLLKEDTSLHEHSYYQALTLCHQDPLYIKKWVTYVNREKLDCNLEFNKENLGIVDATTTVVSSGVSSSSMEQMALQAQEAQDNRDRLAKQEEEEKQNGKLTQSQLDQKEMERLSTELTDLNESMNQEQQFSQKDISQRLSDISSSQSQVSQKGEQLQCLEKALEIRNEEENTQVISLLKDEEMNKVKSVVASAKQGMREAYTKRIDELKKELKKQKDSIDGEKAGYDDLMINLIKGGLKMGDKSKCVANRDLMVDDQGKIIKTKLESFIEEACSELANKQADAADIQGGLLDQINRCTRKEMFCDSCCSVQFGTDELVKKQDCQNDCQPLIDLALMGKLAFTTGLTNIVDPVQQKIFAAQIEKEEAAKNAALASRFKQTNYKFLNNKHHHRMH